MTNGKSFYRGVLHILTCVRQLAPIASHSSALPPSAGAADAKEERIHSFIIFIYAFMYISCRILTAPVGRVWRLIAFSRRSAPKNTIRLPSLLITTAQE